MDYIFWQNILSIHQSAFIRNLSINNKVVLVVEESLNVERQKHGWLVPDFGNTKVIVSPQEVQIKELLAIKGAIHVFTGIDSFPLPASVFKIAIGLSLNIGVMLEPFNTLGIKGKLRFIKYKLLAIKYRSKIDFILAISDNAIDCYKKVGFNSDIIFDWIYFTENNTSFEKIKNIRTKPKLLFVGSIDIRKNILPIVQDVLLLADKIDSFEIIGIGPLENDLMNLIKNNKIIKYIGGVPNQDVNKYIFDADLLILPSIFDGWGAVVNEAVHVGTPVLVSENAGASCLIKPQIGRVFSNQKNNFKEVLNDYLIELPIDKTKRMGIKSWADVSLSAKKGSDYFSRIMGHIYENQKRPIAPWKLT
ncbi:glycosyltransferase family 4 protein [Flavobacterium sp. NG2]|uniref:glycosyltransferase family 4 protein n=1 Tax=Flavobacterium sp. NG2 TaxID=3097547 RepID=UPI002A802BA9|nr:glycosyltransferase family 4 protein [Flavobacterium sp. NG2]WPR71646.1 glycosyltransferase family 4 protein [Flavobacterium sp. NG2]